MFMLQSSLLVLKVPHRYFGILPLYYERKQCIWVVGKAQCVTIDVKRFGGESPPNPYITHVFLKY